MIQTVLVAFGIAVVLLLLSTPLAFRFKLLAIPGAHRHHETSTPLTGGIAIFLSLIITIKLFSLEISQALVLAMTLVMGFGIVDDRWTVPFWIKFVVQVIAALLLVNDGLVLENLGYLFSEEIFTLGRWQWALTVFSIVGVINAINMIDGLDGLVGFIVAVALVSILYLVPMGQNINEVMILAAVLGGLAGFLCFNLRISQNKPAKVFMGDAGCMFLGVFLAWLLIKYSQGSTVYYPPVVALWVLTIPLFDTVGVMLRRIFRGRSPFHADRLHTHHLLIKFGISDFQTLGIIVGAAVICGVFGIVAFQSGIRESTLFAVYIGLFAIYILSMELGQRAIQK